MLQHLAIIMDGNRRWAQQRKEELASGKNLINPEHALHALLSSVDSCLLNTIPYLSVYALSIENLKREDDSLALIYSMLQLKWREIIENLNKRNVRMVFVGDRSLFDASIVPAITEMISGARPCN